MISEEIYWRINHLYRIDDFAPPKIAEYLGLSTPTVRKWLNRDGWAPRKQPERKSILDPHKERIRQMLSQHGYTATHIFQILQEEDGYQGSYDQVKRFVRQVERKNTHIPQSIQLLLTFLFSRRESDRIEWEAVPSLNRQDTSLLCKELKSQNITHRQRAMVIFCYVRGMWISEIADLLGVSRYMVRNTISIKEQSGMAALFPLRRKRVGKVEDPAYQKAVFDIFHTPPFAFDINRTTWRLTDIRKVLQEKGISISTSCISKIIRSAGYNLRNAKMVLTSNDPQYCEKVERVISILAALDPDREKFFSVDEFGPFAIKMRGGRSFMPNNYPMTIPQIQKSRGNLILVGALELSTNQITHFYAKKKDTDEMIKLLDILLEDYAEEEVIYFSWDAASWHTSRKLQDHIDHINSENRNNAKSGPIVKLIPLPSRAQFLNVIESVFSGMARSVLHNSDYGSVMEAVVAIDRHFWERNEYYRANPSKAGNKIWRKERVPPTFSPFRNCKDPKYR